VFDLYANKLTYQHNHWQRKAWLKANPLGLAGAAIFMSLALNTTRTLDEVFAAHSKGSGDLSFSHTEVALRLAHADGEALESRAQAKRISHRLEVFDSVDLDFEGVEAIGQAFADELFRVLAAQHLQVQLHPRKMNSRVVAMVAQVNADAPAVTGHGSRDALAG
jgi:hypothetical protein